jgi:hypothetical protein
MGCRRGHPLECERELLGGTGTCGGVLRERCEEHLVELGRDLRSELRSRLWFRLKHTREQCALVAGRKEPLEGQELPANDGRRVHVGPTVDSLVEDMFGRRVCELGTEVPLARGLRPKGSVGDAEVEHTCHPVGSNHHVLRRNVAVHKGERTAPAVPSLVGRVKAGEDVGHDANDDWDRDHLAARARFAHEGRNRQPMHVLHDDEHLAVAGEEVARGDDVRVLKARREPRLVEQKGGEIWIAHVLPVEALDDDGTRKACVAAEAPEVNNGHTSVGEFRMELVSADEDGRVTLHIGMIARRAP